MIKLDELELDDDIPEDLIDDLDPIIADLPKSATKKKKKETDVYVDPIEMWEEIEAYYNRSKKGDLPEITHKLAKMIDDISIKVGYRPNFINYSYKDEMVGDAKLKMFKALRDHSFKLHTKVKIIDSFYDEGRRKMTYLDKKGRLKPRFEEKWDVYEWIDGSEWVTFRSAVFGYYTHICFNAYLNRIKKEKLLDDTKKEYQLQVWDKQLSTEAWQNVKRPKHTTDYDENEVSFEE